MFNLRSLDLNLLTVFVAIYELGTVSGAADHLALSQSATSHALSRLREACRDDLFVRTRQGLSPTPVANEMYPAIKQALDSLRATLAEASGFDPGTSQRRFRISIPHPMGPFYALALRAAVAAAAPSVVLTFDTVSRPLDLEESLRDGVVDVAIDWLPVELDPFINGKLFDDRLVLLVRRGHPLVDVDVTIEDLLKAEFVTLHHRREPEHAPMAIREFLKLGMREPVHVSESAAAREQPPTPLGGQGGAAASCVVDRTQGGLGRPLRVVRERGDQRPAAHGRRPTRGRCRPARWLRGG